jgi:hypothetical protein
VAFDAAALSVLVGPRDRSAWRHLTASQALSFWHNWKYCTYAMYRHLASEGFLGQKWGLASAMESLLEWEVPKGEEVAKWLVENGYTKKSIPNHLLAKLKT